MKMLHPDELTFWQALGGLLIMHQDMNVLMSKVSQKARGILG